MSLLDKYIIREWLKVFSLILIIITGVMVVERIYDEMPSFLTMGVSVKELLFFFSLYIPYFLPTVIPVTLFVSLLFIFGNFHRHNEIIAMRTAGVTLTQIARPFFFVGLFLAGLVFILTAYVTPTIGTVKNDYRQWLAQKYQAGDEKIPQHTVWHLGFKNGTDNRVWFMDHFNEAEQAGYGVSIFLLDTEGNEEGRILARRAVYDSGKGGWLMQSGREVTLNKATAQMEEVKQFEEKYFSNLQENPRHMLSLSQHSGSLNFSELKELIKAVPPSKNVQIIPHLVHYYQLLATPFNCFLLIMFAIPFATRGTRVNPMVGISKAALLFFLYYLVVSIFRMVGTHGVLPAWFAAWLPSVLMLGVGLYLMRQWEVAR